MEVARKTSERSHIYRNEPVGVRFDPSWGRTTSYHKYFYKHVIPLGLRMMQAHIVKAKTSERSHVYRNEPVSVGFDPSWGRTASYYTYYYKHVIPLGLKPYIS